MNIKDTLNYIIITMLTFIDLIFVNKNYSVFKQHALLSFFLPKNSIQKQDNTSDIFSSLIHVCTLKFVYMINLL